MIAIGVLGAAFVAVGIFRFVVLRSGGAPPTVDAGNWLAFGDAFFGGSVRSDSLVYPPAVPILTWLFVSILGLTNGVALFGALASLAPAAGVAAALRGRVHHSVALIGALIVLASSSVGETAAWGGFPQLLGLGVLPLFVTSVASLVDGPTRRTALKAGALLALIGAVSHFIFLFALVAGFTLVALRSVTAHRLRPSVVTGAPLGWFILPVLPLAPLYLSLATGIFGGDNDASGLAALTIGELDNSVEFLYRESPVLWRVLIVGLVVVAPVALRRRWRRLEWQVPVAMTTALAILLLATREDRYLYVLPLLAAWWLVVVADHAVSAMTPDPQGNMSPSRRPAPVVVGLTLILLSSLLLVRSAEFFEDQRDFYGVLTPDLVTALEAIDGNEAPDVVVAIPAVGDKPVGWWVEAIVERTTIYASPLRVLNFDDEITRSRIGNQIFQPGFPTETGLAAARSAGVDLLVVPERWVFFDAERIDAAFTSESITDFGDTLVIRLGP